MDRIQPYSGHPVGSDSAIPALPMDRSANHQVHIPAQPVYHCATKSPSDYLRAIRQRIWLALVVAVPIGVMGTIATLRMPAVYQAKTTITIEAPSSNPTLVGLLPNEFHAEDHERKSTYLPNEIGILRSRDLAELVLAEPGIVAPLSADPAQDLASSVTARHLPGSNRVEVTMDAPDPTRAKKTLEAWLSVFKRQALKEYYSDIEQVKAIAETARKDLEGKLKSVDFNIRQMLLDSTTIGPGGRSLLENRFDGSLARLAQKRAQVESLQADARVAQMFPSLRPGSEKHGDPHAAELEARLRQLTQNRASIERIETPGKFKSDPARIAIDTKIAAIREQLAEIKGSPELREDPYDYMTRSAQQEMQNLEESHRDLLGQYQVSAPEHQKFLGMQEERATLRNSLSLMEKRLMSFEHLSRNQKDFIHIPDAVAEPANPIKPNRPVYIAFSIMFGIMAGLALVCALEYIDQSVKVPEQLTHGLTLPLFGVIPRMRRTSDIHRGGHLWAAGSPGSLESDAYRNLRASLLGLKGPNGPLVTLLITSAKAGEGKSTTALNLAATCARSGERTLLMDVDLRRPSLDPVFPDPEGLGLGLVDVLRDDLPWSQAIIQTDIPNLDFLPTGDTTKIPIEILGTREMRQLLASLAESHYDRVILDGPAILGLADCRMLGQMVDGALIVVRAGAMELQPLRRAKTMLEQSRVPIAGVVFNGLADDLKNWSSYRPDPNGLSQGPSGGGIMASSSQYSSVGT